ncbi:hypothetical protein XI25_04050 [Paenibacillus sp. DMB20]|nr:hypothetical protein XI25_04050 [Paenibacillus sp. DMB20]
MTHLLSGGSLTAQGVLYIPNYSINAPKIGAFSILPRPSSGIFFVRYAIASRKTFLSLPAYLFAAPDMVD